MQLSRRVSLLKPSATVSVNTKAKQMAARGIEVLTFAIGEPDFDTPQVIKQAAIDALNAGMTKYAPAAGDMPTRTTIAEKLKRENHLPMVTPEHVVVCSGAKYAIYLVMQALIDEMGPGREDERAEVLLPVPAWLSFDPIARLAGANVVEIDTGPESDFKMSPEQLRRAITPKSRVLVINSPSNPCGTTYTPDELRALGKVIAEQTRTVAPDLVVISDEMYEKIIYGGIEHFSLGSIPEIAERVVTISALSKSYAMTGWRAGYLAGQGEFGLKLAKAIEKLIGQTTTNVTSFTLPAIKLAFEKCDAEIAKMRDAFGRRAELIYGLAQEIPGFSCPRPTGAYYLFPDVSSHFGKTGKGGKKITSTVTMAEALLEEARVALVPGDDFGGRGNRHLRISFACGDEQIREGMRRIAEFVAGLR
jgi:aspartate aminotransferase